MKKPAAIEDLDPADRMGELVGGGFGPGDDEDDDADEFEDDDADEFGDDDEFEDDEGDEFEDLDGDEDLDDELDGDGEPD